MKKTFSYGNLNPFIFQLYDKFFKKSIDEIPFHYSSFEERKIYYWNDIYENIKDYFFTCKWYEIYDFIEFTINNYSNDYITKSFIKYCNKVLGKEKSGYRIIEKQIVPIIDDIEIKEIEKH
ncbi:AbiJ-NTD4 domain-containing protein [Marinitoga aeolica]|uniref:HEPN AbiJ-N-terminal domain-containing protein n=1 Tax=Marinitoga aeolica TaxID=2809031 RepID=A0ABY8PN25_9BACT|nr:hypothetical protein [Marinitoga aeolica]WGS63938.1 hypothetical protein JRV97_06040 [Marinitoga aeolica]